MLLYIYNIFYYYYYSIVLFTEKPFSGLFIKVDLIWFDNYFAGRLLSYLGEVFLNERLRDFSQF